MCVRAQVLCTDVQVGPFHIVDRSFSGLADLLQQDENLSLSGEFRKKKMKLVDKFKRKKKTVYR